MEKHAAILGSGESRLAMVGPKTGVPDVTIVTVSTNEAGVLDTCLSSVFKNHVDLECIVVNNASTDETEMVANKYNDHRIRVVKNDVRKSLSENCNIGLREARGRYVLLLNPDTRLQPDTLDAMIRFMDTHQESAFATCRLLNPDGSPQDHIRRFPTPWRVFLRLMRVDKLFPKFGVIKKYLMRDMDRTQTQEVEWFILAFFFVRKGALATIGLLDENFMRPYYCEDIEWCYRARLYGYRNYCVAETATIHDYQQRSRKTFGRLTVVHAVNNLLLYQKLIVLHAKKYWSSWAGKSQPA